ncbi:MAG: cell division protein CrgA [Acidimicrobiia bacterium]|nr:cell division protein CrgA [Acidimicrobiia bacterium]
MAKTTPKKPAPKKPGSKKSAAKPPGAPPPKPGRYTPPKPKSATSSPLWVPTAMFTCLGLGLLVIVGNYLGLLPGGQAQNSSLFIGLGLMIAGFGLSTQYR